MPSSTFNSMNWAANNWPVNSQVWKNVCPSIRFQARLERKSPTFTFTLLIRKGGNHRADIK